MSHGVLVPARVGVVLLVIVGVYVSVPFEPATERTV